MDEADGATSSAQHELQGFRHHQLSQSLILPGNVCQPLAGCDQWVARGLGFWLVLSMVMTVAEP